MYRTPHTGCYPGKRVKVKLIDGTVFIDRFKDRMQKFVFFEDHGRVARRAIKNFIIWKDQ